MAEDYSIGMYNRQSIFQGRNGSDQLSVFLVAIALILVIIYPFFSLDYVRAILCTLALILCALSLYRMFSSNVAKRRNENARFLSLFKGNSHSGSNAEDARFKDINSEKEKKRAEKERLKREREEEKAKAKARKEDMKTHSYFKCPKCNAELRVPKGKGKIRITCPKCGEQFVEKS